jgi:hypothetical protein
VIVPIYLYHRYQIDAAAKLIGGLDFRYAVTGDGDAAAKPVQADAQRGALAALVRTLDPAALDLPDRLLNQLTPGDVGYAGGGSALEVFPGKTGPVFDLAAAADIAADLTLSAALEPSRASRVLANEGRSGEAMSLREMLDTLDAAVFVSPGEGRLAAIARVVQARLVAEMIELSRSEAAAPGVSAVVDAKLSALKAQFLKKDRKRTSTDGAHLTALAADIDRHLAGTDPALPPRRAAPETPPGSPIGAMGQVEECWFCVN